MIRLKPFITLLILALSCSLTSCRKTNSPVVESSSQGLLEKTYIDPHNGYSEAVVAVSGNMKTVFVSGQFGEGPDLDSQMRSALKKLLNVLAKSGASIDDVVKMNTYIVGYDEGQLELFRNVRKELLGDEKMPASTLVGVQSLAKKEWLIEIEAIAVIPQ